MQIIGLISGKKGKLYFKLLLAAVIIASAIYSFTTFAGNSKNKLNAESLQQAEPTTFIYSDADVANKVGM